MRAKKLFTFGVAVTAMLLALSLQPSGLASAESGGPEMALTVTQDGFCDGDDCYAEAGETFMLGVEIVEAPATGYVLLQTFVDFGDALTYNGAEDIEDEVIWPHPEGFAVGTEDPLDNPDTGTVTHGGITGFLPPLPTSTYEGLAVEFELECPAAPAQETVTLLPYQHPDADSYGSLFKHSDYEAREVYEYVPKLNSITLHCVAPQAHPGDTDGDGCSDAQEAGGNPALGGDRDWLNPWDFYDVNGDQVIDLSNDVLGVTQHYGTAPGPPYDVAYDRGPWTGANSWNGTTAPDGVIDMSNDILGVIAQHGHDCR